MNNLQISGARVHNLKGIDVSIPKNQLTVVTGVSGSGKSSLVFDIIFEEGRKLYLQSLGMLTGIDAEHKFDSISGICPTIAVQQNVIRQSNPRSTVGSRTGILNLLGLLYASEGHISCGMCGTPVRADLTCPACGHVEERLEASYFSYNAPNGMCLKCAGRGAYFEIDMHPLVPTGETTLQQVFDQIGISPGYARLLQKHFADYLQTPYAQIPADVKAEIIYGHHVTSNSDRRSTCLVRIFQGRLYRSSENLEGVYTLKVCPECHGFRVGAEARRVMLGGRPIGALGMMTVSELHSFLIDLPAREPFTPFGRNLVTEISRKVNGLIHSHLGHLSLYREMPTLSGGEIQRLFLDCHLDSKLDSLIYILDEPTVGLHESEKAELLETVQALKRLGNTVIMVEHDRNTIETADYIVDIGPKAGVEGGRVVYQGTLAGLFECPDSLTGQYLANPTRMPARKFRSKITIGSAERLETTAAPCLILRNVRTNNLKDVTVMLPLGAMVGIAGVSGSGKSSLIADTLVPLLKRHFHTLDEMDQGRAVMDESDPNGEVPSVEAVAQSLEGAGQLAGFVEVSQAPIGRNASSNPASYIGIWDKIRDLFARQPDAQRQGLSAGHFSFNSKGACPVCGGSGSEKTWLGGDLFVYHTCTGCDGKRYMADAFAVHYHGKTIVDVLEMSITEATPFFADQPGILPTLKVMERIGMGYIRLGQPTPSLSGGEAQRIKLAKEIGRRRKGPILYVLDEPTTGLSLYDTARLIELLDELVAKGNSVLVIEHDPTVLNACDWIAELGPGGGVDGGRIIAEGSPQDLKSNPGSITGKYL